MAKKSKVTGTARSMPAGIGLGSLLSIAITVAGAFVITWLVSAQRLSKEGIGYGIALVQFLGAAFGAWLAAMMIKHRRVQVCLLTGCGYFVALLGSNALFFGGHYSGIGVSAIVILLGSGGAALLGIGSGSLHKKWKRKMVYR